MYGKEAKSVNKSIRITPTALQFIEKFEGNGFNEKLNALVMDYYTRESEIDKAIERKKEQLKQAEERYIEMCSKVREMQNIAEILQGVTNTANSLNDRINEQIKRMEDSGNR